MKKIKVLMIGPARDVKGGITSVVDNYIAHVHTYMCTHT